MPDCRVFKADHNQLKDVPVSLLELENLKSLHLIRNAIVALPVARSVCSSLVELMVSHNNLREIPDGFAQSLPNLQSLSIDHNRLSDLRTSLPCGLKILAASNNELVSVEGIQELRHLEELDLAFNRITDLPDLRNCGDLVSVNVGYNKLSSWPKISHKCATLCLSYNSIRTQNSRESLPSGLMTLLVDNNKIDDIPESMTTLVDLSTLDLRNNDISKVPSELGLLPSLRRILLDGNPIHNIPMSVLRQGSAAILKLLRERLEPEGCPGDSEQADKAVLTAVRTAVLGNGRLDLSGYELGPSLPEAVGMAESLTRLNLSNNNISEVVSLRSDPTLVCLVMSHNLIQSVGRLDFSVLQELDISYNNIAILSEDISLPQLLSVDLSCNRNLVHLPRNLLANSPKLRELRANNCSIMSWTFLPPPIQPHDELCLLDLSDNRLADIPEWLLPTGLPSLNALLLSNNSIDKLPPSLGRATALKTLTIDGNPIRSIPQAVIRQGSSAIIACLRKRCGTVPPQPAKDDLTMAEGGATALEEETRTIEEKLAIGGHSKAVEYALKKQLAVGRAKMKRLSSRACAG
ncbi:Leucine-rich repeat-containing protein 40 [Perkinsus chesapeaki]|uniref:Leucine-rich repeat-containing protein 40 n=1 Tax=Perkinsus chesapeaki TaxID=330153 RepID=A0A7J6KX06_PERCH|nr:Leucine-rich repeat-containing protein 40 [Perkinsus chesapeaki]